MSLSGDTGDPPVTRFVQQSPPTPYRDGSIYRLSALIEKDIYGARKSHSLVRADTFTDEDAAVEAAVSKARRMIDEQGDRLFS